ncbi:hypothetical protein F1880_008109 [Penicillium rolfsii]|nr:hypothetical protein F1880_008109 [Penicillium rolfsii]
MHRNKLNTLYSSELVGETVLAVLLKAAHIILNLDPMPMIHSAVHPLKTTSPRVEVFNTLSGEWSVTEPFPEDLPSRPGAGTNSFFDAACKLGGRKGVIASSIGTCIYSLRNKHVGPDEYNQNRFYSYVHEPSRWKVHGWSSTDARDLGGMREAALRTNGLSFQV